MCCGGIIAAYNGLRWIGVELEQRFIDLANGFDCDGDGTADVPAACGNKERHEPHHVIGSLELHRAKLEALGCPIPVVVRGDSRRFSELVAADACVTSPPYNMSGNVPASVIIAADHLQAGGRQGVRRVYKSNGSESCTDNYGDTVGQIGALPSGSIDAVVSSPPYADSVNSGEHGIDWTKTGPAIGNRRRGEGTQHEATLNAQLAYGQTSGQIGAMSEGRLDAAITSPPYSDSLDAGGPEKQHPDGYPRSNDWLGHGNTEGQIARLRADGAVDAVVTSPPYVSGGHHNDVFGAWNTSGGGPNCASAAKSKDESGYGRTDGQVGDFPEGSLDACLTSPPYAAGLANAREYRDPEKAKADSEREIMQTKAGAAADMQYGTEQGQIARLETSSLEAVVTSPPWQQNCEGGVRADKFADPAAFAETMSERPTEGTFHQATPEARRRQLERDNAKVYGTSEGQISQLKGGSFDSVVTSPPYADRVANDSQRSGPLRSWNEGDPETYGSTAGQIGQLRGGSLLDATVTSPPYADGGRGFGTDPHPERAEGMRTSEAARRSGNAFRDGYGESPGQIGQEEQESYWTAMRDVYRQVWLALKPSGVLCVVVKSYVRAGEVIDLPGQTAQLLEACGFRVFLVCKAWLTEEQSHPGLFGEDITKTTARKSFFRRIYEAKYPENSIDFEVVIWARKP